MEKIDEILKRLMDTPIPTTKCGECRYKRLNTLHPDKKYYCAKARRILADIINTPEWCPCREYTFPALKCGCTPVGLGIIVDAYCKIHGCKEFQERVIEKKEKENVKN